MTTNMYGASAIHKLRRPVFGLFEPPSAHVDFCRQLHDPPFNLHRFFMTAPLYVPKNICYFLEIF